LCPIIVFGAIKHLIGAMTIPTDGHIPYHRMIGITSELGAIGIRVFIAKIGWTIVVRRTPIIVKILGLWLGIHIQEGLLGTKEIKFNPTNRKQEFLVGKRFCSIPKGNIHGIG
jgi:hypothetical protein